MNLDELDHQIVEHLQRDGRLSTRAIGRSLGVAAGTVSQRVAKLEKAGVITGYTAIVDQGKVGRSLAFVVGLQMNQGNEMASTLEELSRLAAVDDVLVVTGRWDLLVMGRVADTDELNVLLTRGLWQSPSFRHSETMLVIDRSSASRARPLIRPAASAS